MKSHLSRNCRKALFQYSYRPTVCHHHHHHHPRLFCTATANVHTQPSHESSSPETQPQPHSPPPTASPSSSSTNKKQPYSEEKTQHLQSAFDFCIHELQKEEPEIYDTMQYLRCEHDHQRLAIAVLRTLHLELSRTRADSNTAEAARIRLNWWKSVMAEICSDSQPLKPLKQSTPLLSALRVVRRRYNLSTRWLMRLVTAREAFLTANTFMSMLELEEYAESTQTVLLYLSMECLDMAYSEAIASQFKCASHIGVLMTIASVLRSIPFSVQNGFIAIPDDIAADCDVWRFEQTVLEQQKSTLQLKAAVQLMVTSAYKHLYAAKTLEKQGDINQTCKSLFLCCIPAQRYLARLEQCGFDVFDKTLMQSDMGLAWKWHLVRKSMRHTF